MIPDPSNPQSWNRYSYVINNPIRLADPTGHDYCDYNPSSCSVNYQHGSGLQGNPLDPNNLGDYESDDPNDELNGGGGNGNDGSEDDESPELILACGDNAGGNCDNTADYDGFLPLYPYYQLSSGIPTIFGNDGTTKFVQALAIYYYIKMKPGQYNLVGHSSGGTALIIAARLLIRDGLGDRINNLVLLDPYMDSSYRIDEKGTFGDIQDQADLLTAGGITVFLGDSPEDGHQTITGAILFSSTGGHLELANDMTIYNSIVTNSHWNP